MRTRLLLLLVASGAGYDPPQAKIHPRGVIKDLWNFSTFGKGFNWICSNLIAVVCCVCCCWCWCGDVLDKGLVYCVVDYYYCNYCFCKVSYRYFSSRRFSWFSRELKKCRYL